MKKISLKTTLQIFCKVVSFVYFSPKEVFIIEKLFIYFLTLTGTSLSFLIGTWHISLTILLVFMVIDIATGLIKSAIERKLSSNIAFNGFLKKATIMIVIIIANLLDILTSAGVPVFRTMAVFFYIVWKD